MLNMNRVMLLIAGLGLGSLIAVTASGDEVNSGTVGPASQIVAHRGSSADRPENTLAAYRRAMEAGAYAIEIDLRLTKDGHLVSLHDGMLDRTTNGRGEVESLTLAEARELDAGSWFSKEYTGEKIPTFPEILALAKGRVRVFLDLKDEGGAYARQVVEDVRRYGDPTWTILGVRSVTAAAYYRGHLPESLQVGLIPAPDDVEAFITAGVRVIRLWPHWLKSGTGEALVKRVRNGGAELLVNVGDGAPARVTPALRHRPEYVFTDDPARLADMLRSLR
ncbi:MAG: glycerophosphodiester phosphodiesterase family protein [Bryobacterales bacterium]|nr:glycerophosphodiester phosphodiesterase family protein [Bryobacterales bacterium]